MRISICGSMIHEPKMTEIAELLISRGYEVFAPDTREHHNETMINADAGLKQGYIKGHFAKIDTSDFILVVNEEKNGVANYIGGNTLIEMAHAFSQGMEVFLLNPVPELPYTDEIKAMCTDTLDGNLEKLDTYIASLPLVHMSTLSPVKHMAVSKAMRRFGVPVRIKGDNIKSGVSKQPMTIAETYKGAMNRHKALTDTITDADYYVTIESGFEPVHAAHNPFGCAVLLYQKPNEKIEVGIDIDIEFPQEVFDEVPSKYADVGVLIQEKYKSPYKDAYPFLTKGRLTRGVLLENALFNVLVKSKELAEV